MPSTVKVQLTVRAFDMGASDYVAKPYSPSELTASTTQMGQSPSSQYRMW